MTLADVSTGTSLATREGRQDLDDGAVGQGHRVGGPPTDRLPVDEKRRPGQDGPQAGAVTISSATPAASLAAAQ
jgi:hypothetical protein